jgi:hypothetical protein
MHFEVQKTSKKGSGWRSVFFSHLYSGYYDDKRGLLGCVDADEP